VSRLPVILAVDGDPEALERVGGELRRRYGADYVIACESGPGTALTTLEALRGEKRDIALVLADQACTDLLDRVRELYPRAKRGLLIPWGGWGDDETASAIREAMASGRIDYYVLEPWTSPDEYFHRTISELLLEWQRAHPTVPREVTVVCDPGTPRANELRTLLARNGVPHAFRASDSPEGRRLLEGANLEAGREPVVFYVDGRVLENPSNTDLARGYRVPTELDRLDYDVVVVGAGPGGLSAAVYASCEGLDTLVVERESIGGQASSSSRIRNYLGFPRGLSGSELAQRAYQQAWVFRTSFVHTKEVRALRTGEDGHVLTISDGAEVHAGSVILAMGIAYRRLEIPALERLINRGVFYGTSSADAQPFADKRAVVVGGGNSAGQAAIDLARYADEVTIVVRGPSLDATMSQYLRDEISAHGNIALRCTSEIVDATGSDSLETVTLRDADGESDVIPADGLFVLIGARPRTDWLPHDVARDEGGYVLTDEDLGELWPLERRPFMFETSRPGVFAVGDVRSHSSKRVAAAVGEGSVVVQQIHRLRASGGGRVTSPLRSD
jgi:thioredoxin reductase (NADPH)